MNGIYINMYIYLFAIIYHTVHCCALIGLPGSSRQDSQQVCLDDRGADRHSIKQLEADELGRAGGREFVRVGGGRGGGRG